MLKWVQGLPRVLEKRIKETKGKEKGEKWKMIMVKKKNASSSTNITEPTCTKPYSGELKCNNLHSILSVNKKLTIKL